MGSHGRMYEQICSALANIPKPPPRNIATIQISNILFITEKMTNIDRTAKF